ncbi:peptidoglycan-associated lipoprotein Pal [Uliginosibacterium gangwonense]|uniref:peptidoglycan-associated lipoprotein Pal n=1 Tax=Uliginosibacterium gangwonense TaxID=392736 RepID=UPI000370D827|nr:peptidoglycan-associated lipoprotein Pal [Uliginosibacterium gangwonense]
MKKTLLASVILSALLAACTTTPTEQAAPTTPTAGTATTTTPTTPAVTQAADTTKKANPWDALKDPNNILSKRSVYFDFDKYEVKLDYMPLVEAHAKFLKANGDAKVLVQGNADERGSSEYNLALGQKRANAVKQTLTTLGVKDSQIEAVSLGKEKPRATGHDEASWAENRRDDILYNGEY